MRKILILSIVVLMFLLAIANVNANDELPDESVSTDTISINDDVNLIEKQDNSINTNVNHKDSKVKKEEYIINNTKNYDNDLTSDTNITSICHRDSNRDIVINLHLTNTSPFRRIDNIYEANKTLIISDTSTNKTLGKTITNDYGLASYTISRDYEGRSVTVDYLGDNDSRPSTLEVRIPSIQKRELTLCSITKNKIINTPALNDANIDFYKANEDIILYSQLFIDSLCDDVAIVTVKLNNQVISKKNIFGTKSYDTIRSDHPGLNTIEITYEYEFLDASATYQVYITQVDTHINITPSRFIINKSNKITVDVYDEYNKTISDGRLNVKVNDEYLKEANQIINYNISKGKCIIEYITPSNLKYNLNEFTVIFTPKSNMYTSCNSTIKFMPYPTNASMIVTTDKTTAKMGEQVTFTAEIIANRIQEVLRNSKEIKYDSGKDKKAISFIDTMTNRDTTTVTDYLNEVIRTENYRLTLNEGVVIFKINGVTIKDKNANPIKIQVKNNKASLDFTIPDGWSAKPIKITAVYSNKYFDRTENKTYLNLTKIQTNITFKKAVYKNNTLSIQARIYDKNNHTVLGRNIIAVKINGITIKRTSTRPQFYTVNDGVINLNILINNSFLRKKINTIQIVTGERNAYLGCRNDYRIKIE